MSPLARSIARHPIRKKPYNAIKLVRVDGATTPLYKVAGVDREVGACKAMKLAFERFGAHCYHCGIWMPAQPLSHACTRDHLRPKASDGSDHLHNLVFACGSCNVRKGKADLVAFHAERGSDYLRALQEHLARCMAELA